MEIRLIFRMMRKQKLATILNILCLSFAFAVFFVVVKQVKYDFTYNTCYTQSENIYTLGFFNKASKEYTYSTSMPFIHEVMSLAPEITDYTITQRSRKYIDVYVKEEEKVFQESYTSVTAGFFKVFQPRIIAGDAEEVLKNGTGMVIPLSLARKWFGKEDPLTKRVALGNKENQWTIKAVYEDFPENCETPNDIYIRLEEDKDYSEWSYHSYFRVVEGVNISDLEKKLISQTDSLSNMNGNGIIFSDTYGMKLESVKDLYFDTNYRSSLKEEYGSLQLTLLLLAIGILIIVVAYINFINFSTALAPSRIRTFNICIVTGVSAWKLRWGLVSEAVFLSVTACLLSVGWVYMFNSFPWFTAFFNASLIPTQNIGLYLLIGIGAIVLGILAGIYPAYYMTSFRPAMVLKGSFALSAQGRKLRNCLLVFQFIVSIILIIASIFIVLQYHYLRDQSWGFEKDHVVYVRTNREIEKSHESFRNELLKNPYVLDMTASRYVPGEQFMGWGCRFRDKRIQVNAWPVTYNFLTFFHIPIEEGENFHPPVKGRDQFIFNRKMVEYYDLKEVIGVEFGAFRNRGPIIGITKDVNFASLHNAIEPLVFVVGDDMWNNFIFIKIRPENVRESIGYIKECMKKFGTEQCEVKFLNDYINGLYQKEENLSNLISLFCLITILISLAGIYGLILFNIRYKVKEVGIRKINGATEKQMLYMLNRIFIRLILLSFILAAPFAYLGVSKWLDSYPYHMPVCWWVFPLAVMIIMIITLITVSWQSWKAATANPVEAVRTE